MIEFPKTYSALLISLPGVGKAEYCMHLAREYLKNGEKVVYVTTEKSPVDVRERMREIGADIDAHEGGDFLFIDVFTRSAGEKEEKVLYVDNPSNLNMVSVKLSEATDVIGKPVRIIFDSLSTFFLHAPENEIRSFFESINTKIKMDQSFALFTLHDEMHDEKMVTALKAMVLSVLEMDIEDAPSRRRKFRAAFAKKGVSYSHDWFEFKITKQGLEFTPIEKETKTEEKKEKTKKKRGKLFKIARTVVLLFLAFILLTAIFGDKDKDIPVSEKSVYFHEDFDDGAAGWSLGPGWAVEFPDDETNGMLTSDGSDVFYTSFGSESWSDYDFSFKAKFEHPGFGMNVYVRSSSHGAYGVYISEEGLRLWKEIREDETEFDLTNQGYFFALNQLYDIRVELRGDVINVYVNDEQIIGFTDVENPHVRGDVGFETYNTRVHIDDIEVANIQNIQYEESPSVEAESIEPPTETIIEYRITGMDEVSEWFAIEGENSIITISTGSEFAKDGESLRMNVEFLGGGDNMAAILMSYNEFEGYDGITLWSYVPEATSGRVAFFLKEEDGSDYMYIQGRSLKKTGWIKDVVPFSDFAVRFGEDNFDENDQLDPDQIAMIGVAAGTLGGSNQPASTQDVYLDELNLFRYQEGQ